MTTVPPPQYEEKRGFHGRLMQIEAQQPGFVSPIFTPATTRIRTTTPPSLQGNSNVAITQQYGHPADGRKFILGQIGSMLGRLIEWRLGATFALGKDFVKKSTKSPLGRLTGPAACDKFRENNVDCVIFHLSFARIFLVEWRRSLAHSLPGAWSDAGVTPSECSLRPR